MGLTARRWNRIEQATDSRQGRDLGRGSPLGQARVSLHRLQRPAAEESKKMVWIQRQRNFCTTRKGSLQAARV